MKASGLLAEAGAALAAEGVTSPRLDALLLLADALSRPKEWLLAHPESEVRHGPLGEFRARVERRAKREPLQYIRGFQEFWGLPVKVGPGVLIPRPETEHLVEAALDLLKPLRNPVVLEVGAGSGCLLMALSSERPDALLVGVEKEEEALRWARENLAEKARAHLARADLQASCPLCRADLILSNPPYLTEQEWLDTAPEVRDNEPRNALVCGEDPLGPYRLLAQWAAQSLRHGGHLAAEIGTEQAKRAGALRRLSPSLSWVRGVRDLAGRLRVAIWAKK